MNNPEGYVLVQVKQLAQWREWANNVAAWSTKAERSSEVARLKASISSAMISATQPTASNAGEREAFEAWVVTEPGELSIAPHADGGYLWSTTNSLWFAWQARAALASKPVAPPAREVLTDEMEQLLTTFERQANRFGELWERCQGKGWPAKESDEFHSLRDDRMPKTRAALKAALSTTTPAPAGWDSQAARDVLAERQRQISAEGWSTEHDDAHGNGGLAEAAACYAMAPGPTQPMPIDWPWEVNWWKPKDWRSNLVRAGALILAEIERLDRAARGDEVNQK